MGKKIKNDLLKKIKWGKKIRLKVLELSTGLSLRGEMVALNS